MNQVTMPSHSAGRILLAPMEGLVDHIMRDMLTQIGGIDECVTEFLRITDQLLPVKVFKRICPEIDNAWRTPAGTPVVLQLLGSDADWMAENAQRAARLGTPALDINFGCPAKTVNRHRGGAVLLEEPETLFAIVRAVRQAVPDNIPVTAKMRLGYKDRSLLMENAKAIEEAGASQLVIHARTKVEGYKPPAHWQEIEPVRQQLAIPVVANGDVCTVEDYHACRQASGCQDVMIGRGLVAQPWLALQIRASLSGQERAAPVLAEIAPWLEWFLQRNQQLMLSKFAPGRVKQWLKMLAGAMPDLRQWVELLQSERDPERFAERVHAVVQELSAAS
ncbi:tRNA-dihydrouridine synthase family protein [Pokkaliibacter sp. MBI-7]|uniref:tRNA dihydrouridine synthase n=1 Tax=Pokkaliibacter sp. MBI-7 TaxID=3040600 RepID=UPI00244D240E|nr:tRNA-dihydrouridine synthase family protein [Pokkaliibacter sp. MBI-7]MDH2435734.1 tRNA-dihydrouridine synthase family protein [Pokkaliibacter sp. MBI-7]